MTSFPRSDLLHTAILVDILADSTDRMFWLPLPVRQDRLHAHLTGETLVDDDPQGIHIGLEVPLKTCG